MKITLNFMCASIKQMYKCTCKFLKFYLSLHLYETTLCYSVSVVNEMIIGKNMNLSACTLVMMIEKQKN